MGTSNATQVGERASNACPPTTELRHEAVDAITSALRPLLADVFALYMKTKNFHWHMRGRHFRDYHLLLDEHAEHIFVMTDAIAERAQARRRHAALHQRYRPPSTPAGQQRRRRHAAGHAGRTRCGQPTAEDLTQFDVPTLIVHSDDDQIVPIGASALLSAKLIKNAQLTIYEGGSHGICSTQKDQVNADLLAFFKV